MNHYPTVAAITAIFTLPLGLPGCQPACTAPSQLALIIDGQRDVVRCPVQLFTQTLEEVEPFRQCVHSAVAAQRPFVAPIRVGRPDRDSAITSRFLVGRVNRGEFEIFLFHDVNSNLPESRVIGTRCEGFSQVRCFSDLNGVSCDPVCSARVNDPPSPPYAAGPVVNGLWCGPAF